MATSTVTVNIIGDASKLKTALQQSESALGQFSQRALRFGQTAFRAGARMSAAITLPIVALTKVAFDELAAAEAATAQTNAVIKSTGGVANVTARHVDDLAQSILNYSGIDDEAVKAGENLLLTFTGIRNEVGKGNDIFDQATVAVADLSKAFHKDLATSAILVGKALQDPVRGVTALRRVGVQLTDSQVELIKKLVESGDLMGAQKVILGELQREVGGSARAYGKTFAGQIDIAKESLKNSAAEIIKSIIPTLRDLALIVADAAKWFSKLSPEMKKIIVIGALVLAAIGPIVTIVGALATTIGVLTSPITLVVAAILAWVAATVWLAFNWNKAMNWIKNHPAIAAIIALLGTVLTGGLLPIAFGVAWLASHWQDAWDWISTAASDVYDNVLHPIFDAIAWIFNNVLIPTVEFWRDVWTLAWPLISGALNIAWGIIQPILGFLAGAVDVIRTIVTWIGDHIGGIWGAFTDAVRTMWDAVSPILGFLIQGLKDAKSALDNLTGNGASGALPGDRLTALQSAQQAGVFALPVLQFASGGVVPGMGNRDSVPAMLTPGEVVLNKRQQHGFGGVTINVRELHADDLVKFQYEVLRKLRVAAHLA